MIPRFSALFRPETSQRPWPGKAGGKAAQVAGDAYEKSCDVFVAIKVAKWLPHTNTHTVKLF